MAGKLAVSESFPTGCRNAMSMGGITVIIIIVIIHYIIFNIISVLIYFIILI